MSFWNGAEGPTRIGGTCIFGPLITLYWRALLSAVQFTSPPVRFRAVLPVPFSCAQFVCRPFTVLSDTHGFSRPPPTPPCQATGSTGSLLMVICSGGSGVWRVECRPGRITIVRWPTSCGGSASGGWRRSCRGCLRSVGMLPHCGSGIVKPQVHHRHDKLWWT